jgi:hypothetical protein
LNELDGLFPQPLRLLFYDIETAPMLSFHWEGKTEYIPAQMVESDDRFLLCWSAKWSDQTKVITGRLSGKEAREQADGGLVSGLVVLMRHADYVVAHIGNRFDYKRVNARLFVNRLQPLGQVQMIDTLSIARTSFDLPYNNLDYLARKLGFGQKLHTSFELWRRAYYGEVSALKEMEAYNRQDVVLLEHVFHAMAPYAKTLPRLVDAVEWRQELCPYCGSQERSSDGFYRMKVQTYAKYRCRGCQRNYRGWQAVGSKKAATVGL